MTKDIPKIDDLLDGINDSEEILENPTPTAPSQVYGNDSGIPEDTPKERDGKCWERFMAHLDNTGESNDREDRLVCKIDRDLADSLDDCDIGNKCRSDLVNAIVRAFFETHITRLLKFRREKKSLFRKFNDS